MVHLHIRETIDTIIQLRQINIYGVYCNTMIVFHLPYIHGHFKDTNINSWLCQISS